MRSARLRLRGSVLEQAAPEFLWGAATSAHQVEGNNIHNDWWAWEKSERRVERSGKACDHYNRFREDFELAQTLGHNAHRLSIEWSRIEPEPGVFNYREIAHYRRVLEQLKRLQLTSFVTLHHFTNPLWLAERGGWEHREASELFERYVRKVVQHLGDAVDFWMTINEPMVYATQSYWQGVWPPGKRNLRSMLRVIRHMARAHRMAYRTIHHVFPGAMVGMAKSLIAYMPHQPERRVDTLLASWQDWWFNHRFFALTGRTHDFIGVNFYLTVESRMQLFPPSIETVAWDGPQSDLDWPIRPEGLLQVLLHMRRYELPIYITENGLADADDSRRADFIRSHIRVIEEAQSQGADVRGYLHWSLLDNFEWAEGFRPRFGLVEVNYDTLERKPRPSAYVLKAIIEQARRR